MLGRYGVLARNWQLVLHYIAKFLIYVAGKVSLHGNLSMERKFSFYCVSL